MSPSSVCNRLSAMKLGITSKLFLVILLACALVAFAMALAMRYSFQQGFLGYLNEQENQRIELLRPALSQAYLENGGWDFLREKPRLWFSLIRSHGMQPVRVEQPPPAPGSPRPARTPAETDLTGLNLRISLLDTDNRLIIGDPRMEADNPQRARLRPVLKAIRVDNETVGWLALIPFQQVSPGAGERFQQQQWQSSWLIGAIAVLLAALSAFLLARMLLAPVRRIADSTHKLTTGDYGTRVSVSSSDELGTLAQDFNHLALTLERNEKLRRAFMADVSHELRTPLSVLKGELEAIEDGIRPLSLATTQSLQSEVATLDKLINDLYELSLADAGALSYRMVTLDLAQELQLVLEIYAPRLAAKSIAVDFELPTDAPLICKADPDRLRQLFGNLFENTLRYTDAGGQLRLACAIEDGRIILNLQDSAPGVAPDQLPHLFERFYRAEGSRNRATGGAGLGLAICRNIVEAHQGSMNAQASPLGGLWIRIVLPLTENQTP